MALRDTGASRSPSSAEFSRSSTKERLSAIIPANVKVIQSTLGAIASRETLAGSRAKLKITSTSAAKATAAMSAVLLRCSTRMSFAATARAAPRTPPRQHLALARGKAPQARAPGTAAGPAPLHQHVDVGEFLRAALAV